MGMAESPVRHKEPVMGSSNRPYRETCMRGFEPLPVAGFLLPQVIRSKGR